MGYCISMDCNIKFKKNTKKKMVDAINALHAPEKLNEHGGGSSSTGEKWYSWVDTPPKGGFKSLEKALEAWRYRCDEDDSVYFEGEKLGDDEILWTTLAPFIAKDSFIQCTGEDGCVWRWVFNGKTMKEVHPTW